LTVEIDDCRLTIAVQTMPSSSSNGPAPSSAKYHALAELRALASRRRTRQLTAKEREQFLH
jgi:hypothetical protein